jgi:hypothetical protein
MNDEGMWKPALAGGVFLGVLSSLPIINLFNIACCAWVLGGGVLASYLYVKDSSACVTLGRGAAVGLAAGLIGAIVSALFTIPLYLLMARAGMGIGAHFQQMLDQFPNLAPETREALRVMFTRKDMSVLFFVSSALVMLAIYCPFAMLGGTIGVALFEKRKPGAAPVDLSHPSSPTDFPPPPPPDAP